MSLLHKHRSTTALSTRFRTPVQINSDSTGMYDGIRSGALNSGRSIKPLLCSLTVLLSMGVFVQQAVAAEKPNPEIIVVEEIDLEGDEQQSADLPNELKKKFYIGIGAGASDLDPDTSDVEGVELSEGSQTGFQVTVGADLNKWFSLEFHGADLGSAELNDGGEISYREYGLSGLFYGGKNRGNYNRNGLTFFGRLGVGALSNDATEEVEYEKQEGVHVILGAGAEYAMRNGLALRVEGMAFDSDVSYAQLGLLYRFGSASGIGMPSFKMPFGLGDRGKRKPFKAGKPLPGDIDGDGVGDTDDECAKTLSGQPINEKGCPVFGGVIEGLNFYSSSAELTDDAKLILDELSETLLEYPKLRIRVSAHTDSLGDDQQNMLLSRRRALAVSKHLVAAGVSKFRLEAVSYGETKPIASNKTRAGRSQNRRVELIAVP